MDEIIEKLAELEHLQWCEWSLTLDENEQLSPERIERWKKLWVEYSELNEAQKEQDREWARKVHQVYKKAGYVKLSDNQELPLTTLCDCGHPKTGHYRKEGQCYGCACTWYHPNIGVVDMIKVGFRRVDVS